VNIGQSVTIKGTLTAREDLTIDGSFEGRISIEDHVLTIGPNGRIKAEIQGKSVVVGGEVTGNITADDRIEITASGSVRGDIRSARIAIADGARLSGHIDMGRAPEREASRPAPGVPAASPPPSRATTVG